MKSSNIAYLLAIGWLALSLFAHADLSYTFMSSIFLITAMILKELERINNTGCAFEKPLVTTLKEMKQLDPQHGAMQKWKKTKQKN